MNRKKNEDKYILTLITLAGPILLLWSITLHAVDDEFMQAAYIEKKSTSVLPNLLDIITGNQIVYVGETHVRAEDHMLQLAVIKHKHAKGIKFAIGVEWFQQPFQPIVDGYIAGEVDEEELLIQTEYFKRWAFDYRLMRPIMRFARENSIPVLALNIDKDIIDVMMRDGVKGLTEKQRKKLPLDYDRSASAYTRKLHQLFEHDENDKHPASNNMDRFMDVQLTWDESMAEAAASYLKKNPEHHLVVLAGRGHTHPGAIPARVERRTGIAGKIILNFQPSTAFNDADYIVLAEERELSTKGIIGVGLRVENDGIYVSGFSDTSRAKDAGMKKGDRILALGDNVANSVAQLKYHLIDYEAGETIELLLLRNEGKTEEQSIKIKVQLIPEHG
jgi:uncharacterized iron-regulated protein